MKAADQKRQLASIAKRARVPLAQVVEEHSERSAIREYLGEMPRAEAEEAALQDTRDVFGISKEP